MKTSLTAVIQLAEKLQVNVLLLISFIVFYIIFDKILIETNVNFHNELIFSDALSKFKRSI